MFSWDELRDIFIIILGVTFILSFPKLQEKFLFYFFIVTFSILLKQTMHKISADKRGCMATFKLWVPGILLGIFTLSMKTIFGFIFTALGRTEISPYKFGRWGIKVIKPTPHDYGKIILAGLYANMCFFLLFGVLYTINPSEVFKTIGLINWILFFFNFLPIPSLDGGYVFTMGIFRWLFMESFSFIFFLLVYL